MTIYTHTIPYIYHIYTHIYIYVVCVYEVPVQTFFSYCIIDFYVSSIFPGYIFNTTYVF